MRLFLGTGLFLFAILIVFGCGGDSSDPTEVPPAGVEGATLSVNAAGSMGRVGVDGLPAPKARADSIYYHVVLATGDVEDITMNLDRDEGGWFFRAPLHPVTPNDGGSFRVRITQGENQSEEQMLDVGALPEAPGAFASLVVIIREHLEQRAELAGTTIAELKATAPENVSTALLPLKLAQSYLDSDDDPNDLTELSTNEGDFLSADHAELLDRVFGYFDLEALLQMEIDAWPVEEDPAALRFGDKSEEKFCINAGPDLDTAPELSIAMTRSAVAQFGADPNSEAGEILEAGADIFSVLGLVPVLGGPAGVAGAAFAAVDGAVQFVAGILPSYFVSMKAKVDKSEFNEDSTEFAKYSDVEVKAASTGWSADKSIANVIINALGARLSLAEKGQILGSDFLRDLAVLDLGLGAGLVFDETGIIEFCPEQWEIDISSPLYCTAASLSHKFDVDIEGQKMTVKEDGSDQLRVAAQSTKFGNREIHLDFSMLVKKIMIDAIPPDVMVQTPGDTVGVTASIRNADLTTLRWTPAWGAWVDGLGDDTNDGTTRLLKTPTTVDAYPYLVTIESLTRNGIRSEGLPVRAGFATVRLQDTIQVYIDPQYVCIDPGDTVRFKADVAGLEEYTVEWSVIEGYGSIDQNGLYQAVSGGTSNAVIEARLEEKPDEFDTADLDASACNCSLDIKITGDTSWTRSSSQIAYSVSQFEDLFYQFFFDIGNQGGQGVSASIGGVDEKPSPQPGDTGTWQVSFVYFNGSESWHSVWDEEIPLPGVSLNLTELTETSMEGSFTGNAFQLDENNEITSLIGVDVKFRAGHWDGGAWPCE